MLETIRKIVIDASVLMKNNRFEVKTKDSPVNLVTDMDVAVEKFLREALEKAVPGIGFIGEEEDASAGALEAEYTAVVDPIDGTTNFVRGMPLSVISVALLKRGAPYIGVVYNPYTDELFYAERGCGAYQNGRAIHVSARPLNEACYFTAWSLYKKEYAPPCFDLCQDIYYDIGDIRRLGVCALELCYLAAGRGELYFEIRVFPWDFAAAQLILTEAGGFIGTVDYDAPIYTRPQPILAANSAENFEYLKNKVKKHVPHIPYTD